MDILLNELSLDGQFTDTNAFLDNLKNLLYTIKLMEQLKFNLLKDHSFFNSQVTNSEKFIEIAQSRDSRVRKLKSFLLKLSNNPPFWNTEQKHNCSDNSYIFNSNNVCETSLAESCERDKFILSFKHNEYLKDNLLVKKNTNEINLYNILDKNLFLDYIFDLGTLLPAEYCKFKFKDTNLNFTLLDINNGFNLLNTAQVEEYISSFKKFSSMNWIDINSDGGFQYKPYKGDYYKNTIYSIKKIKKFRTSQLYRCFGYREEDIFYILRFEINHKISDDG